MNLQVYGQYSYVLRVVHIYAQWYASEYLWVNKLLYRSMWTNSLSLQILYSEDLHRDDTLLYVNSWLSVCFNDLGQNS